MSESVPPVNPPPQPSEPQPDQNKLQGATEKTQFSLLLRAALDGVQQALRREGNHAAKRKHQLDKPSDQ